MSTDDAPQDPAPTPLGAAPAVVRRQQLVAEAMGSLAGVAELPVAEQLARLGEAQTVLSGVLQNPDDVSQLTIPGVARRP